MSLKADLDEKVENLALVMSNYGATEAEIERACQNGAERKLWCVNRSIHSNSSASHDCVSGELVRVYTLAIGIARGKL